MVGGSDIKVDGTLTHPAYAKRAENMDGPRLRGKKRFADLGRASSKFCT